MSVQDRADYILGWAGVALGVAVTSFFTALTIMMFWAWFVVPLGVGEIGLAHAVGLAMFARFALFDLQVTRKGIDFGTLCIASVCHNAIALLMGYGVQAVM